MKRWGVQVPITGSYYVEVEAETREEAITKALDADYGTDFDEGDLQWSQVDTVVEGNVFHGELNKATARELKSKPEGSHDR